MFRDKIEKYLQYLKSKKNLKTAKKFITQFGSMEGLLANTDQLKGKMREKVEANGELGLLSKKLATIMLDVPVEFDAKDFELNHPDVEKVKEIFQNLEFRRLTDNFIKTFSTEVSTANNETTSKEEKTEVKATPKEQKSAGAGQFSLFGGDASSNEEITSEYTRKTAETSSHFYQSIASGMATKLFVKNLMNQTSVCFDTETTGLNPLTAELVGIAFSWEVGKGFYIPFPENKNEAQELIEMLRPFFENENIEKIGQNLKYDIKVLAKYNINVKGKLFDTMLAHYLINPDMRHNMEVLAETYLNYTPISITELIGKKGKNQLSMRNVPIADQTEYAVEDADITFQLKQLFTSELETGNVTKLFKKLVDLGQHPKEMADTVTVMEKIGHFLEEEVSKLYKEAKEKGFNKKDASPYIEENLDLQNVLKRSSKNWDGGYAMAGLLGHGDAFVLRDPAGIRPAYYYQDDEVIVVASERPVIQTVFDVPFESVQEVEPGHALLLKKDGSMRTTEILAPLERKSCSFERIYFSRGSDAEIYQERKELGRLIMPKVLENIDYDTENTVFSFIPNTAETSFYGMLDAAQNELNKQKNEI